MSEPAPKRKTSREGASRLRASATTPKCGGESCGTGSKVLGWQSASDFLELSPREKIESLLGNDVFFVPCEWGTKKPLVTYVERPFEGTKTDAYRAVFDAQEVNVAVYLGNASGGLCAIDFDADEDLDAFLGLNPKPSNTTRSRGSRGGMLWMRIDGDYPESCNPEHKHFEWRADKRLSTIYGRHPA